MTWQRLISLIARLTGSLCAIFAYRTYGLGAAALVTLSSLAAITWSELS